MTTTLSEPRPRRVPPRLLAGLLVVAVVGGVEWAVSRTPRAVVKVADAQPAQGHAPVDRHAPVPVVTTVGQVGGWVRWDRPLSVSIIGGTFRAVTATGPDGRPVRGTLSGSRWTSSVTLLPSSPYRLTATVVDAAGRPREVAVSTHTTPPAKTLHTVLDPGDGNVVGVGMPVIVTLDHAVAGTVDRAAVVGHLSVTTTPAVTGRWRWVSPTELHYRGPTYWPSGTTIRVRADLTRLLLADGTWGQGVHTTAYRIGSSIISTVDVTKHVMTVAVNGKLVRTVKVSTGRDKYPTKGGVHLVLEKTKLKIMDSSTVGIPRNGPGGYYEKVPDSVRISYGGAFVHSAGWSVRDQGIRNVSHGCVNISPTDAAWFFDQVKRGDVVDVIHASVGPKLSDPGMSDWNIPFAAWAN